MSIQRRSRSAVASAVHRERPHLSSTVLFWTVMLPPTVFLLLSRSPHVLPLMSVLALACAAIVALAAWCTSSDRDSKGISLWDLSGAYAFVGFAAGMLSDPEQLIEFWSAPRESPR
jgi:hypothetical protein